jgi:hypothetical protein
MNRKSFSAKTLVGRPWVAVALAALVSGCSGFNADPLFTGANTTKAERVQANGPTPDAEKIRVNPLSSDDLDCPSVDIAEGGSTFRVGGAENNSVRYQFDISDVARQCIPQGAQFALKIGISGLALVGPAGAPGTFSTDLKLVVASVADKKPVYQKAYKVTVNTNGGLRGSFELVADPILLPLTRTDLDNLYTVTVGFGNSVAAVHAVKEKNTRPPS